MHEFVTVSASSYDPASLASKLNEKSAEGWDVVAIVPTGGDVTAFLSRDASSGETQPAGGESDAQSEPYATSSSGSSSGSHSERNAEPAGWGVAPDAAPSTPSTPAPDYSPAQSSAPATVIQSASPGYQASVPSPASSPTPSVPAGWYADPAGRFDLRYWDGGTWTEHVARGGQQYTDPPVA